MSVVHDALETTELERALTVKDRLNYPFLLSNAILTFHKSILNLEHTEREIREAIEAIVHMVPVTWKDPQFEKDYKDAQIIKRIDIRPRFCGTPATLAYCKEHAIPAFNEETIFKYFDLFQAVVNLLDRRNMLTRRDYTEIMTGKRYKGKDEESQLLEDLKGQGVTQ